MVLVLGTPEKFLLHKKACSSNWSFGFAVDVSPTIFIESFTESVKAGLIFTCRA